MKGDAGDGILHTKVGTCHYMAPEIISDHESEDANYSGDKVDIFAIGVILFNMRTAIRPFITAE